MTEKEALFARNKAFYSVLLCGTPSVNTLMRCSFMDKLNQSSKTVYKEKSKLYFLVGEKSILSMFTVEDCGVVELKL